MQSDDRSCKHASEQAGPGDGGDDDEEESRFSGFNLLGSCRPRRLGAAGERERHRARSALGVHRAQQGKTGCREQGREGRGQRAGSALDGWGKQPTPSQWRTRSWWDGGMEAGDRRVTEAGCACVMMEELLSQRGLRWPILGNVRALSLAQDEEDGRVQRV